MIVRDDLLPGVTKVRVTRHDQTMAVRLALETGVPDLNFGVPAIGAIGVVDTHHRIDDTSVYIQFEGGESPYKCDLEVLEIVENPPKLELFPVGTRIRVIALDPRHTGAGAAIPHVGLEGVIAETKAPAWCQAIRVKSTDLGYDDEDDAYLTYFIRRDCLESRDTLSANADPVAVKAVYDALKNAFAPDQPKDEPKKLPDVFPDATIDTRGHWSMNKPFLRRDMEYGEDFDRKISMMRLFGKLRLEETPEAQAKTQRLFFETSECHVCAKKFGFECSDDRMTYTASTACAYPGGFPTFDVLLAVPSGKIVFANDLRPLVTVDEPRVSINYMIGQRMMTEAHAKAGLVMIQVGNTCPGIWQQPDGSLAVANYRGGDPEDDYEEDDLKGVFTPLSDRGVRIGSICTDLWAFSAMDHGVFHALCTELSMDPKNFAIDVAEVEPGTYAFSVESKTGRDTATEVFSRITKTDRVADPIVRADTGLADRLEKSQAYRTLHGLYGVNWQSALFVLTVCGNGFDWTDGFLRDGTRRQDAPFRKITEESPDTHPLFEEIPVIPMLTGPKPDFGGREVQWYVYPLSRNYCELLNVPQNVDPWWLALVLLTMKRLMVSPEVHDPKRDPVDSIRTVRQGLTAMLDLVESRGGIDFIKPYMDAWATIDLTAKGAQDDYA